MTDAIRGPICRTLLLILVAPILFTGCAQTKVVDSWQAEKDHGAVPEKVAVMAVLPDALMRKATLRKSWSRKARQPFPAARSRA